VQLPLQICDFDHREIGKRVRAALDKVGLLNREKSNPITLSGGEQQRLCIARAIVNRPSILLADEPTGNLDAEYAEEIMHIFKSFHQVGVTLLISTHDTSVLRNTPLRVLELKQGEIHCSTPDAASTLC
jgi:cell division transport system ATP-binding protein